MFLGIDLSSTELRPSAGVGLNDRLEVVYLGLSSQDANILDMANLCLPQVIAIDAPLSLPFGMCCLENGCSCQPLRGLKGRHCERELARLGIPCYFTTKRSIIKRMVSRAIMLKSQLEEAGFRVIEVYPYASKVRLFGKVLPPKGTEAGLTFLKQKLGGIIPGLLRHWDELNHDLCDAAVAAYTAFLYDRGETEAVGYPGEGLIYVPCTPSQISSAVNFGLQQ